jgi:hypothetical protein
LTRIRGVSCDSGDFVTMKVSSKSGESGESGGEDGGTIAGVG